MIMNAIWMEYNSSSRLRNLNSVHQLWKPIKCINDHGHVLHDYCLSSHKICHVDIIYCHIESVMWILPIATWLLSVITLFLSIGTSILSHVSAIIRSAVPIAM